MIATQPINEQALEQCYNIVYDCIEGMDKKALNEMISGYERDLDSLIDEMVIEAYAIVNNNSVNVGNNHLSTLTNVSTSMDEALRNESMTYFVHSVFGEGVDINTHHIEWGMIAEKMKNIAILAARDHGKSFWWTIMFAIWKMYRHQKGGKGTRWHNKLFLIQHTDKKAKATLRDIKGFIKENPILNRKLYHKTNKWAETEISTRNGCYVELTGIKSAARGYHPHVIMCDDIYPDEAIWSETVRGRVQDTFDSVILQMLDPNGQMVVVGTPFHEMDLYARFKKPEWSDWFYQEYPAIFPSGKILWPKRYSFRLLMNRRSKIGSVAFSREFLCRPVASDSTVFPYDILGNAVHGMEKYVLVNNLEAFPVKFDFQVSGHDFSISQNVKADYTFFTVWGIDPRETMWLLDVYRKKGATFNEQIGKIKGIHQNFRPSAMVLENNVFQAIYQQFLQQHNLPIFGHTTGTNKHKAGIGLASMTTLFENNKLKMPYGDERSRNIADLIMAEFNNFTVTDKGVVSIGNHDDGVMSTWHGWHGIGAAKTGGFSYTWG